MGGNDEDRETMPLLYPLSYPTARAARAGIEPATFGVM